VASPWLLRPLTNRRTAVAILGVSVGAAFLSGGMDLLWVANLRQALLTAGVVGVSLLSAFGPALAAGFAVDFVRQPEPASGPHKSMHRLLRIPVLALGLVEVLFWPILLGWAGWLLFARHVGGAASLVGLAALGTVGTMRLGVRTIRVALKPLRTIDRLRS
jgi:hypothetical protein